LITFIFGAFMVLEYFVSHSFVDGIGEALKQWATIITAFAFVLGVANIIRINLQKAGTASPDRPYAIVLLVGLLVTGGLGTFGGVGAGSAANRIFLSVFTPLQATMFSLLAFFIASAAFRAFRIRSWEAGFLAVTALLVMIGRVPVGVLLSDALGLQGDFTLTAMQEWLMNVPNLAAKRAIMIGAALGAIATGFKIIVGIERNYLGE
jgi:hypothetical protein